MCARADYRRGVEESEAAPDYAHKLVTALTRRGGERQDGREAERGETDYRAETCGVIRHQKRINKCRVA